MRSNLLLGFFLFFGFIESSYCINNTEDELNIYFDHLKNYEFKEAVEFAKSTDVNYKSDLILFAQLLNYNGYPLELQLKNKIETLETSNDKIKEIFFYLIKGYYSMTEANNRSDAFELLIKSKTLAEQLEHKSLIKQSLLGILTLYRIGLIYPDDMFKVYLDGFRTYCEDSIDLMLYYSLYYNLYSLTGIYEQDNNHLEALNNKIMNSMDSIRKLLSDDHKILIHYYTDKAAFVSDYDRNLALNLYNRALDLTDNSIFYKNFKFNLTLHLARIKLGMEEYWEALKYANESAEFINPNDSLKHSYYVTGYKADIHAGLGNYDSAYTYMRASRYFEYQMYFQRENAQIAKLEIENNVQQKELENLELKARNSRNRNLLLAALSIIVFGGIVAVLIQKNTKRKQLLAESEKTIQNQKLATVLKEQELKSIDAMIEGQEKERQRIANDLHDDLGSVMTNLKLHVNALKDSKSEELYEKTNQLVQDAYDKVRLVSHAKNSGVMAKEGLLKAVQKMASTMSLTNKIDIEVVYHGLEERLENSLELTIFRIIQELVTNILKHAEASEVTINLIQHDDKLNIMVEDNGKGFKTNRITTNNSGMGLNSIDKRVEHLNGELTIESELGKGTTIIIDIPI